MSTPARGRAEGRGAGEGRGPPVTIRTRSAGARLSVAAMDAMAALPVTMDDRTGGGPGGEPRARGRPRRTPRADRFLDWLKDDQEASGFPDAAYAPRFGLSASHWGSRKVASRALTRETIERICLHDAAARDAYIALCLTNYRERPLRALRPAPVFPDEAFGPDARERPPPEG